MALHVLAVVPRLIAVAFPLKHAQGLVVVSASPHIPLLQLLLDVLEVQQETSSGSHPRWLRLCRWAPCHMLVISHCLHSSKVDVVLTQNLERHCGHALDQLFRRMIVYFQMDPVIQVYAKSQSTLCGPLLFPRDLACLMHQMLEED